MKQSERVDIFTKELLAIRITRIPIRKVWDTFDCTFPEWEHKPDRRRRLLDTLYAMEKQSAIRIPQSGWEASGNPPLPRTIMVVRDRLPMQPRQTFSWVPVLSFAADITDKRSLSALRSINGFLKENQQSGCNPVKVPVRERSLEIFGDEKRLDDLNKGDGKLFGGQLSFDDLYCYPVAPPLVSQKREGRPGRPVLVVENHHSYYSFCSWNERTAAYAAIAFGSGGVFYQGVKGLDALIAETCAGGAMYIGDLDPKGLEILLGVGERRRLAEPCIQPHHGLYAWLLENGSRGPLKGRPRSDIAARLTALFSEEIVGQLLSLWESGKRIAQENFGMTQLCGADAVVAHPDAGEAPRRLALTKFFRRK